MRNDDTANGYGWISIALHWITAVLILAIWFIGSSIAAQEDAAEHERLLRLHTSIAITAYALLWVRIAWRFYKGHPGPLPRQAGVFYSLGKYTHYAMLIAIALMLVSGPLMVWARGMEIHVFDWFAIPSPYAMNMGLYDTLHGVHVWGSRVILVTTLMHIGGVYKHAAFNQDGTFGKMLDAARKD